jgi:hypothetical protein
MSALVCRQIGLSALCAALLALGAAAAPAQGAAGDPAFVFTPSGAVLPAGGFDGPCGLAVDRAGNFYVSDYYRHVVDVFGSAPSFKTQLKEVDPLDGPCGLAVDFTGKLYANGYHRNVVRYTPSVFPPASPPAITTYGSALTIDSQHPTGVAVDTVSNKVYVDRRSKIAVFDSAGTLLEEIGGAGIGDGYGVAFSQFAGTAGRVYVPDADSKTVKVYNPPVSATTPEKTIAGPPGGFNSLVDSAIAVDRVTGEIYVGDRQSSVFSERPQSTIQVFDSTGAYEGHLKYNVVDAAPVGLAVDNSTESTQGRVYVTSGNTVGASVYAYPPGSATTVASLPPTATLVLSSGGAGSGAVTSQVAGIECSDACQAELPAGAELTLSAEPDPGSAFAGWSGGGCSGSGGCVVQMSEARSVEAAFERLPDSPVAAASEIKQAANLRLSVSGELSPRKLPRHGAAPIAVSVGWQIATTDGAPPPKLKKLKIEINRAGRFDLKGLPTCPYAKIQPATTSRALANCRSALVGRGKFSALVTLEGQESYVASGEMLLFNGRQGKKPVLLGQIYSASPFANSFVIVFALDKLAHGTYSTSLTATLPASLRTWGSLTEIQMRLARRFGYQGESHSFLSAGCPAPKGFTQAAFPLARTSFSFAGAPDQSLTLNRSCSVRG